MMRIFAICALISLPLFAFAQTSMNMDNLASFDNTTAEWSDIWGYVDELGNEYAISGNEDSIYVIDVTECANPKLVYSHPSPTSYWKDFKVFGDYAYSVCDVSCSEGLKVYDLSGLPDGPVLLVNQITTWFTKSHNLFIDEANSRLYASETSGGSGNDLVILDLSVDPVNPTLLFDGYIGGNYLHDLNVKNNIIYASHFNSDEFRIYDATDPQNITLIEALEGLDGAHASWNDDQEQWAYLIEEKAGHTINVIDMSNLTDPNNDIEVVNQIWDPISGAGSSLIAHNLFVVNDFLYMSHYEDGVKVYDISDRGNPVIAAYNDIYPQNGTSYSGFQGTWGIYPFFPSGCIVASDITHGVNMLQMDWQISDTCTPLVDIVAPNGGGIISASNHLTSNQPVSSIFFTEYKAEMSIELKAGFQTNKFTNFTAEIAPCTPNN